jgi:hypothetical protein
MFYGERDAASVLMCHGRKVAYRRAGDGWARFLDGKPVSLADLEDAAQRFEPLAYRYTEPVSRARPVLRLLCSAWSP